MSKFLLSSLLWCLFFSASAQTNEIPKNWHQLSLAKDSFYGINLNAAYQFLKEKKKTPQTIVVAVLDSGIDTAHEDLKNSIWHNPKEIPFNEKDDDGNGYSDDVYGWNFLGGKDGKQIKNAGSEKARVYHKYKKQFDKKDIDTNALSSNEKYVYQTWLRAKQDMTVSTEEELNILLLDMTVKALKRHAKVICNEMGCEEFTCESLEKYTPKTSDCKTSKFGYISTLKLLEMDPEEKSSSVITQLEDYIEGKKKGFTEKDSIPADYRAMFVQDNVDDITDKNYGNNNVKGPGPMHGTHVAGIIAADRNNDIGATGIANNVQLMALRVVPDGDEYDKDVALAIFYAVNNGAKVINMSFGKSYSPHKNWVDSAIQYAAQKDVLIVQAAGNDAENIDEGFNFPNAYYLNNHAKAPNYLCVGASTDPKITANTVIADFSNYGLNNVDVFAPGVKIYSTVPHINNYSRQQGTSMASPVVAGLAALIRGNFPSLTAIQVKQAIENSVYKPKPELVNLVSIRKKENIAFDKLCKSGGIVDAEVAVKLAYEMEKKSLH